MGSFEASQSQRTRKDRRKPSRRSRLGGRRAILAGTAAAALLGPLAAASLSSQGAGAASNNDTSGVLKYGFDINNEFTNFDPSTSVNDCGYTVMSNIYQSVTAPGQYNISGGVAQSWTVSNNSSTVTLHIRPNMVFSNGEPVTSTDVMDSLLNTKKSPLRSSLSAIASMTTPDPDTLVVQLNRPTAGDFLWAATYIDGMVYPPSSFANAATTPGRLWSLRPQELSARILDRVGQEPEVLGLQGLPARRGGLR